MTHKLNPFHQQLWRSPQQLQIGIGDGAVVLNQVTANQQRFIDALRHGFADSQLPAVAKQTKVPFLQAQELLARLDGLLLDASTGLSENLDWNQAVTSDRLQSPELVRASLDRSALGQAVIRARGERTVVIPGRCATAYLLAQLMERSGVGRILVHPEVRSALLDLGSNQSVLKNLELAKPSSLRSVDLVFHIGQQVIDPREYRHWIAMGIAQLGIAFQPTGVSVSSVRRPLDNGCLRCEHLFACDFDPAWAVLAAQLLTCELKFDDAATRSTAAGLASHQAIRWLDGLGGFVESSSMPSLGYRFSSVSGAVTQLEERRHDDCDCLDLAQQLKVA